MKEGNHSILQQRPYKNEQVIWRKFYIVVHKFVDKAIKFGTWNKNVPKFQCKCTWWCRQKLEIQEEEKDENKDSRMSKEDENNTKQWSYILIL